MMKGRWLFDTDARLTCMLSQQFRFNPMEKRPTKLTLNQREARGVPGRALIPGSDYLFPMEWSNNTVI
jgi:hypothetical protein